MLAGTVSSMLATILLQECLWTRSHFTYQRMLHLSLTTTSSLHKNVCSTSTLNKLVHKIIRNTYTILNPSLFFTPIFHKFGSLIWIIDLDHWFGSLIWIIDLDHWFGSLIWIIDLEDIVVHKLLESFNANFMNKYWTVFFVLNKIYLQFNTLTLSVWLWKCEIQI